MTDTKLPEGMVSEAVYRLDLLDDLNAGRQSGSVGSARFIGKELLKALDRFHHDWTIVREALDEAQAGIAVLEKERHERKVGESMSEKLPEGMVIANRLRDSANSQHYRFNQRRRKWDDAACVDNLANGCLEAAATIEALAARRHKP